MTGVVWSTSEFISLYVVKRRALPKRPFSLPPNFYLFPNHPITGLQRTDFKAFAVTERFSHLNHAPDGGYQQKNRPAMCLPSGEVAPTGIEPVYHA